MSPLIWWPLVKTYRDWTRETGLVDKMLLGADISSIVLFFCPFLSSSVLFLGTHCFRFFQNGSPQPFVQVSWKISTAVGFLFYSYLLRWALCGVVYVLPDSVPDFALCFGSFGYPCTLWASLCVPNFMCLAVYTFLYTPCFKCCIVS